MVVFVSFCNCILVYQNRHVSWKEDKVLLMKFSNIKFIRSCGLEPVYFIASATPHLGSRGHKQFALGPIVFTVAASRRPLTVLDSEPTIHDMYDSSTMIMRLKATIQSLEVQMSSVTEKSANYAQISYHLLERTLLRLWLTHCSQLQGP
ncbi:unnamed protein product [Eruca vesicaria subsp. sativa]|uniref:DUF676 domain-containing protein n=1 Tax=Eruca vesicaria subsp. sativa TaxID=29727 RepID=A0ABC8J5P3_ERUVS|nr:unnamed protein product [Eruca vesicaria subsp. sativa]